MARKVLAVILSFSYFGLFFASVLSESFHSSEIQKAGRAFILRDVGRTLVTPTDWCLSVALSVILITQAAFLGYILSSIGRNPSGYLLSQCDSLPDWTHICVTGMNFLGVVWIIGNASIDLSNNRWFLLTVLILMAVLGYFGLRSVLQGLEIARPALNRMGLKQEIILNIILIQNGISCYLGWTVCAVMLGAVSTFKLSNPDTSEDKLGTVFLSILAFIIIGEILEERYHWEEHTKYLVSHYIMYILATVGILSNGTLLYGESSLIVCTVVLFVAVTGLVLKISHIISRSRSVSHASFKDLPIDIHKEIEEDAEDEPSHIHVGV